MAYLTHVKSPFKAGVDTGLGYRTLILGPNKSNKSAITQSVEFLLTGKASNIVGRQTVADVNTLLTLGTGDVEALWAHGSLSDGEEIELRARGKKVPPAPYPAALPLREVKAALAGAVETVRKFFLQMASGTTTKADIEARIPGPFRDLFDMVVATTHVSTPAADLLLHALEKAKERARNLSSEAKAAAVVTSEVSGGLQAVSESDLTTARTALVAHRNQVGDARSRLEGAERIAEVQERAAAAVQRVEELSAELAKIVPPADADRVREHALELVRFAQRANLTVCPCCRTAGASEQTQRFDTAFWKVRENAFAAKAKARSSELMQYNRIAAELALAQRAQLDAEYALSALASGSSDEAMRHDMAARADADQWVNELRTQLEAAQTAAHEAEERVISLERASEAWALARRARDAAATKEIEAQKWSALADACKDAVGEVLDASTKSFVDRVQKFLPADCRFHLELHDGDREVCRYGFLRTSTVNVGGIGEPVDIPAGTERLDTALSGAEWATLGSALSAAYLEALAVSGPAVIIPDDCAWDAQTLSSTLAALSDAPCQVILATTPPAGWHDGLVPAGWTVIVTGPLPPQGEMLRGATYQDVKITTLGLIVEAPTASVEVEEQHEQMSLVVDEVVSSRRGRPKLPRCATCGGVVRDGKCKNGHDTHKHGTVIEMSPTVDIVREDAPGERTPEETPELE
jgi:hypothetical protein